MMTHPEVDYPNLLHRRRCDSPLFPLMTNEQFVQQKSFSLSVENFQNSSSCSVHQVIFRVLASIHRHTVSHTIASNQ